jgi:hypothetical protein
MKQWFLEMLALEKLAKEGSRRAGTATNEGKEKDEG